MRADRTGNTVSKYKTAHNTLTVAMTYKLCACQAERACEADRLTPASLPLLITSIGVASASPSMAIGSEHCLGPAFAKRRRPDRKTLVRNERHHSSKKTFEVTPSERGILMTPQSASGRSSRHLSIEIMSFSTEPFCRSAVATSPGICSTRQARIPSCTQLQRPRTVSHIQTVHNFTSRQSRK